MGNIVELSDIKISGKSVKSNGQNLFGGDVYIHKISRMAIIEIGYLNIATTFSPTIPNGFRPISPTYINGLLTSSNEFAYMYVATDGTISFKKEDGTTLNSGIFRCCGCWLIADADVDI